jgi:voltage-gated sodium channel
LAQAGSAEELAKNPRRNEKTDARSDTDLDDLLKQNDISPLRIKLARWIESRPVQLGIIAKVFCYRLRFWKSGWNIFDFLVVGVALLPGAGLWAVLRTLRILRVLRLLTVVPSLRKVVAAFIHSIPGLSGVMAVMAIFFYATAVLATGLFGQTHPEWFGSLGASLSTLFQVMTLESWSMGIVRPVMESHPWAWLFFVPFIIIATFTILNLFIGIIVTTMQELSITPEIPVSSDPEVIELLERIDNDLRALKAQISKQK